tara:strand:+ start:3587 stop:4375 length:789 start_codon:yes stop_codon:yes gene_type:complete
MSDESKLPSREDLSKLTKSSIVMYGIRCALRVQPFLVSRSEPTTEYKTFVVDLNREFKNLTYTATLESARATANSAAVVAHIAEDNASNAAAAAKASANAVSASSAGGASNAAASAARASTRVTTDVRSAAVADFKRLVELDTEVTDASETGPLGDLWHGSIPDWYIEAKAKYDKTIAEWEGELKESKGRDLAQEVMDSVFEMPVFPPNPAIEFYIDPGDAKKETIQSVLECLSDLHIAAGGFGLEFIADDMNIKSMEGVTK